MRRLPDFEAVAIFVDPRVSVWSYAATFIILSYYCGKSEWKMGKFKIALKRIFDFKFLDFSVIKK